MPDYPQLFVRRGVVGTLRNNISQLTIEFMRRVESNGK